MNAPLCLNLRRRHAPTQVKTAPGDLCTALSRPLRAGLVGLLLLGGAVLAQVCAIPGNDSATTTISGIVNSYYPGTGANVAAGSLAVPLGTRAAGGAATPIAPGDLLVLIQMQGAQINSSNSDCYGDGVGTAGCATRALSTASYAGGNLSTNYLAGVWEYCTATTAAGASVGVACAGAGGGTVNTYQNVASAGTASPGNYSYQVVRVPQYGNVALTGNLTPLAWNGSTGGVLVLQSSGAVNMAGFNLDASARGFRGGGVTFIAPFGPPLLDPVNGTSFYRAVAGSLAAGPGGEREGSFKGEGIAGSPRLVYNGTAQVDTGVDGYPDGSRGRGAPGNAGGGGNNQNTGGGGGGNGGLGGQGGGGWNDVSRPTTFRDAGGASGDGASRAGNNLALNPARLIMGGGGGGGHVDGGGTNCQNGGWGGNGGGIVIVRAASLAGTGSLLSNGANGRAPNTAGSCTDAAGGAGAGGTIVAAVGAGLAGRTMQANGGNGANSSFTEHGPGGGGGGGVNYFSLGAGAPVNTATGGINGITAAGAAWFSTPGATSSLNSSNPAVTITCSTLLAVTKTDGITSTVAGGTTSYTVTFTNTGSTAANNATVTDNPGVGLSCSVASCTASTTPIAAACPAPAQLPNLLTGGVSLPTFPPQSTVTFVVSCGVTATGQ